MEEKMHMALLRMGYSEKEVQPPQVRLYYRMMPDITRVIMCIMCNQGMPVTAEVAEALKQKVGFLFPGAELFTLYVTDHIQELEEENIFDRNGWIVDTKTGKLHIYEYQPGDFYGLREILENVLQPPKQAGYQKRRRYAPVTALLVVINVIVFLILDSLGDTNDTLFMLHHGAMYPELLLEHRQYYRLFTEMFIHFGPEHLLNNMLILFFLGDNLERALGKLRYLMLYLLSGLCGSLLSYGLMLHTGNWAVCGGASGAVFGMIGGLLLVVIKNRGRLEDVTASRLVFMIILTLYYGFTSTGIDNAAHLGGLVSGFVLAVFLYRKNKSKC